MPEEVLATSSRPDAVGANLRPNRPTVVRSTSPEAFTADLLLTAFDLADTDTTCPVRFVTTQPTQALTMLNSDFTGREAAQFGDRLRSRFNAQHTSDSASGPHWGDATPEEIEDAIAPGHSPARTRIESPAGSG